MKTSTLAFLLFAFILLTMFFAAAKERRETIPPTPVRVGAPAAGVFSEGAAVCDSFGVVICWKTA